MMFKFWKKPVVTHSPTTVLAQALHDHFSDGAVLTFVQHDLASVYEHRANPDIVVIYSWHTCFRVSYRGEDIVLTRTELSYIHAAILSVWRRQAVEAQEKKEDANLRLVNQALASLKGENHVR